MAPISAMNPAFTAPRPAALTGLNLAACMASPAMTSNRPMPIKTIKSALFCVLSRDSEILSRYSRSPMMLPKTPAAAHIEIEYTTANYT